MLDIFDVVMWWWLGVNRTLNRPESKTRLDVNTVQAVGSAFVSLPALSWSHPLPILLITNNNKAWDEQKLIFPY